MPTARFIVKFLNFLRERKGFGLLNGNISVKEKGSAVSLHRSDAIYDRFLLEIPYATGTLDIFVIFQALNKYCPPDFISPDLNFVISHQSLKSLNEWNPKSRESLYLAISEITKEYKTYNIEKLKNFVDIYEQYILIISNLLRSSDDIEVFVDVNDGVIEFLIRMHLNFKQIPKDFFSQDEQSNVFANISFQSGNLPEVKYYYEGDAEIILQTFGFVLPTAIGCHSIENFLTMGEIQFNLVIQELSDGFQQQSHASNSGTVTASISESEPIDAGMIVPALMESVTASNPEFRQEDVSDVPEPMDVDVSDHE